MKNHATKSCPLYVRFAILACAFALVAPLHAQNFQNVAALKFTKAFAGAEPLPQVLTIAYSNQTTVRFSVTVSTSSGGSWLSTSPTGNACCFTPLAVSVVVTAGSLPAGTYSGQVVITNFSNSNIKMTIPVTLTVAASGATFFDDLPGKLSFSFRTSGVATSQTIQIRNAGAGTLNWTLTKSTATGANWISVSATSGAAPSTITVGITKSALPGGGATAGTFVGQLLLQTSGDSVSIPVAVTVGAAPFSQVNSLNFTMAFGGANPLTQVINVAMADNSTVRYSASVATAKGGKWLSISPSGNACCFTPLANSVSVTGASLAAGFYTGEIIITEFANPGRAMVVPVTLTIVASGAFFADLPGQLSFSVKSKGTAITPQTVQIGNGGSGTLNWTLTSSTADGGHWLTATPVSGTAPSAISVGVNVSLLPGGGGAVAGEYIGQLVLQTNKATTTIPVTVTVGVAPFTQLNPISFTMPFGGANPLPQVIKLSAIDNSTFRFSASVATAKGGNWLSISPSGNACCFTPLAIITSVSASTLAAGNYTAEIIFMEFANPGRSMVLPVNLTILANGAFFDNLPGALSFSFKTSGTATQQIVQIRNGGTGALSWTVSTSTADGGAWLSATPLSGTAPSIATISVTAADLPGGGQLAGTFSGQLVFQTAKDTTTIPVTVTVGTAAFTQMNPISFTMPFGGANALPQVLNISTTDESTIRFSASAVTAKGGAWLSISPTGNACCFTPLAVTASVNASTLAAGTYTGEIIITEFANPGRSMTIPVTLTVAASGAFFDSLPGGLSFSVQSGNTATPQTLLVRNGGAGTLSFTATTSTADGGGWLAVTPTGGSAPKSLTVSVNVLNLPGGGILAGTFTGQLLLEATGGIATVPVTVTVGKAVFAQVNPISFVMPFGGANPLPQILTIPTADNSTLRFTATAATSMGGNWLSISPFGNACCFTTLPVTVSINASSLAVGNYTGEIRIVEFANPGRSMTVPVNLAVVASSKALFDNLPGQTNFSFKPTSANPPSQTVHIGNGGAGTLNWSVSSTTADPGKWITVSPTTGVGSGTYTVSVTTSKLPGKGLIAGTYIGQQVLNTTTGNVTIPVSVTVGDPVFVQVGTVTFNTTRGVNPTPQSISVASTGTAIRFTPSAATGKGGTWLHISPSGTACCFTPTSETISVNASALAVGTYVGEINVIEFANPGKSMTIPVVLNVNP
jgi:hypothetical protein